MPFYGFLFCLSSTAMGYGGPLGDEMDTLTAAGLGRKSLVMEDRANLINLRTNNTIWRF